MYRRIILLFFWQIGLFRHRVKQKIHLSSKQLNFSLPALTVAQLYKCRWRIEIFSKWIEQYLQIKTFFGTTENAVKTQIWIAISVYILVAIVKKELKIKLSLSEILQILSIVLFEKVLITQVLTENLLQNKNIRFHNQLLLFDL